MYLKAFYFIHIYSDTDLADKKLTLGVYDQSSNSETWRKEFNPKTIVINDKYDVALIEFDGVDFSLNSTLRPICLPESSSTDGALIVTG